MRLTTRNKIDNVFDVSQCNTTSYNISQFLQRFQKQSQGFLLTLQSSDDLVSSRSITIGALLESGG